ncbi:phospholipase A and acyltransferase 3-like isoform X2 [Rhineura floridana]|uniref:phospholipase A and acyltransferase 3-like isoform X2 n=1 Tax=Rhineura floridana TaxID=261503 RepID=UPI002AC83ED7|nr:phospholipase A and acyltransferase 3-like isoform X2 [Rhineura floridana]
MSDYYGYVEAKPGDLIEISRLGYQHWAIYVGSGYVIHLAPSADACQPSISSLMCVMSGKGVVKKELLWSIVGGDVCRVNNKYDRKYKPFPASKIVRNAESLLGKEMCYSFASENCEHFATRLRYGIAKSDQVRDTLVAGTVGLLGVGVLAAMATVATSFLSRKHREE